MDKENECPLSNCNESEPPPSKKKRLSLSLKNRFKSTDKDQLQEMSKLKIPPNTSVSTRWAMKNFSDWFENYNSKHPDDLCPNKVLLPSCDAETLNEWLCVFICETRTTSGESYPPRSVYSLLSGILRYMRSENPSYPNFLDKKDPKFAKFTTTLDNLFKDLRASGVGADSKHTEGISMDEEDLLWKSEVLNVGTPLGLLRAVFFYNGKCFCLRGGQEHRDLQLSQLKRLYCPDRYMYYENTSKNRKGGLSELQLEHKSFPSYANPDAGVRCHVFLLDLYISKLPKEAVTKDIFYCRQLPSLPTDETKPWYAAVPVGRNVLTKMVATMCAEAGIKGTKSNHSLRVAG